MPKSNVVRVQVHYYSPQSLAAGLALNPLVPSNLGTAVASVSDGYEYYRWRKLKFRIFAATTPGAASVVAGYPNAFPASIAALMETPPAVLHLSSSETVWSRWVVVPPEFYKGPFEWYHTRLGTYDVTEVYACSAAFAGTGTAVIHFELVGEMEFKDIVNTSSTPLMVQLRARIRAEQALQAAEERHKRLMQALQAPSKTAGTNSAE